MSATVSNVLLSIIATFQGLSFAVEVVYTDISSNRCVLCKRKNSMDTIAISWIGPHDMLLAVGGKVVDIKTNVRVTTNGTDELCIMNITFSDLGSYKCYEEDPSVHQIYDIRLYRNIRISNRSNNGTISVTEHTELTLECIIIPALPTVLLQWTYKNKTLSTGYTDVLGYTFMPSFDDNNKTYSCEAYTGSNRPEFVKSVALYLLVSPPSEPLYIQIVEYETRIFIKWLPNPVGSHKSETYTVEYRRHKDTEWKTIQGITSTHIFVNDLVPNTLYFVQLYAVNQDGKSNRTAEYVVKTEDKISNQLFWPLIAVSCISGILLILLIIITVFETKRRSVGTSYSRSRPSSHIEMMTHPRTRTIQTMSTAHYVDIQSTPLESTVFNDPLIGIQSQEANDCDLDTHHNHNKNIDDVRESLSSDDSETVLKTDKHYEILSAINTDSHNYIKIKTMGEISQD